MNQPISPPFGKQDIRVSKRRKRILYIDDNEDSAEMMPLLLGLAGYKVTAVPSVQANVEIATGGDFDLILLENWLAEGQVLSCAKPFAPSILIFPSSSLQPTLVKRIGKRLWRLVPMPIWLNRTGYPILLKP
jgi:DNA-binding NtrC family response regulator